MCLSSGQTTHTGVLTGPHEGAQSHPMTKPKAATLLPPETAQHVAAMLPEWRGYCPNLSEALGGLMFGQAFGWKGLYMIHSRAKVRAMETTLGLVFREVLPERTALTSKIYGIRIADELGKFWAVVKGEIPVPGGKGYADDEGQSDLFMTG